tara:strand:+ start:2750 stop:3607 length:858 start_codon:yes stop_codon:yes gene_type:complete
MLHIATVATHSERYLPVLEKMVEDKGLKLEKLGYGKKYQGHFMKDLEMIKFLEPLPKEDIVIFLDGFDTIMLGKEEEILEKFKSTGKKMIISIENVRNSFLCHSYHFQKVQTKYINTGLYIGYCGYVLNLLKEMYSSDYNKKSNQTTWSKFLNSNPKNVDLKYFSTDIESKLFLNDSFTCNNKFDFDKNKRRVVLNSGQTPCFLQGNGVVNLNKLIKDMGYEDSNIYKKDLLKEQIKYSYNAVMKTYPILKYFIGGIILAVLFFIFIILANYKLRNSETYNLTFS